MEVLHQLGQDDDGHWYCVPVNDIKVFNDILELDWDELSSVDWDCLSRWRVDGPHQINFRYPVEETND